MCRAVKINACVEERRPLKASASKPFGMAVNVSGWGIIQNTLWANATCLHQKGYEEFFSVSCEVTQDENDWRLRIVGGGTQLAQVYLENGR